MLGAALGLLVELGARTVVGLEPPENLEVLAGGLVVLCELLVDGREPPENDRDGLEGRDGLEEGREPPEKDRELEEEDRELEEEDREPPFCASAQGQARDAVIAIATNQRKFLM